MPEYLSPSVYVEEVDTGSKPIEGVSTSTAGMVGVTERGPVNVPTLVTSYAEYQRVFGQTLTPGFYAEHRYVPHAVEGFFTNGGKRVYVTRVTAGAATPAERTLVAVDPAAPAASQLAAGAAAGGTSVVVMSATGLAAGAAVQIGSGAGAEFQTIQAPVAVDTIALEQPLARGHASGTNAEEIAAPVAVGGAGAYNSTLTLAAPSGARSITCGLATPAGQIWLLIGAGVRSEYVQTTAASGGGITFDLATPLQLSHPVNDPVVRQTVPGAGVNRPLDVAAGPGATMAVLQNGPFATPVARFAGATPDDVEIRRVWSPASITVDQPAYTAYPAGTLVERITLGLAVGGMSLPADVPEGATVIQVHDRTAFNVGDILEIGGVGDLERMEVAALPTRLQPPDDGAVVLRAGVRFKHPKGSALQRRPGTPTALDYVASLAVDATGTSMVVTQGGLNAADILRITPPGDGPFFHSVTAAAVPAVPQRLPLSAGTTLVSGHPAGSEVVARAPMLRVLALDTGVWGNRLHVAMEEQPDPLLRSTIRQPVNATSFRLRSTAGLEVGTELVITSGLGETSVKVASVDLQNDALITLDATTPAPGAGIGDSVRTREYRFVVELRRQTDPTNPARGTSAIDREVFSYLSLDPRHSRYFQTVIGTTWAMGTPGTTDDDAPAPLTRALRRADRRSEGESAYVRVRDLAASNALRTSPVASYDQVPGGLRRLVLLPLAHGDDAIVGTTFGDTDYIGTPGTDPELDTGLYTLRNVEEISIVAVPGRTSPAIQGALINHCELLRYRFAVLDGRRPPGDSIADIRDQRQQFDTKYAALYHPWLLIPDPYPVTATPPDYPIPPSGHVVGVYARTDIERGVHKAPANEVVRGVVGLQRVLNKEQHDILNPYPVNVNVIRDFRTNNRGIRVYGGRVITSDSDWKYVNVRRLLIFIEASIDRGLQWVVFEPNAEPLWARVRRSIANFLTLVWRNGGLEGTKVEEAFFVKCDRTTMTQTDIDQGRLIVLVGVAPVKPAEFVIVRIGLWTAHADD
jgi:phage tail sheath protein FI